MLIPLGYHILDPYYLAVGYPLQFPRWARTVGVVTKWLTRIVAYMDSSRLRIFRPDNDFSLLSPLTPQIYPANINLYID